MPKSTILLIIGITSLIIISCSLGSIAQIKIESQSMDVLITEESSVNVGSLPEQNQEQAIIIENTPMPTVDPLISAKSCLAKTWEIKGLSEYVLAAVPPELAEEYSLEYVDTTGAAYLTLTSDKNIELRVDNLEFLFNARFSIFEVPVTVSIDGIAVGTYQVDSTTLFINNMDTSELTASAKAMNEDIMDSNQIINSIPFVRPPFNTAEYSCQGDMLTLKLSGYPDEIPPLVFQAVK